MRANSGGLPVPGGRRYQGGSPVCRRGRPRTRDTPNIALVAMHELFDAGFWADGRRCAEEQTPSGDEPGRPGRRVDKEARGGKPVMLGLYRNCDSQIRDSLNQPGGFWDLASPDANSRLPSACRGASRDGAPRGQIWRPPTTVLFGNCNVA